MKKSYQKIVSILLTFFLFFSDGFSIFAQSTEKNDYYVLSYDLNGENGVVLENEFVKSGMLLPKPQNPNKNGENFIGWFTEKEDGKLWDFTKDTMPQHKLVLYAQYTKTKDTITLTIRSNEQHILPTSDDKQYNLIDLFGLRATDSIEGDLVTQRKVLTESDTPINYQQKGEYNIKFVAVNNRSERKEILVKLFIDAPNISGIVFDDSRTYNSILGDGRIQNAKILLIDSLTNLVVNETLSGGNGNYQMLVPEGVVIFYVKVEVPNGYIIANRKNDSIIDPSSGKSEVIELKGRNLNNLHIGLARSVRVTINPNKVYMTPNTTQNVDITVSGGEIQDFRILENGNEFIQIEKLSTGLSVNALKQGEVKILVNYIDVYGRSSTVKSETIIYIQ